MKEKALNQEFYSYYDRLSVKQKKSILSLVKSFLGQKNEKAERISLTQYNRELEEAEARITSGNFISHEAVNKEAEKW